MQANHTRDLEEATKKHDRLLEAANERIEAARQNLAKVTQEREDALADLKAVGIEIDNTIKSIQANTTTTTLPTTQAQTPPQPTKEVVVESFTKKLEESEPPQELLDLGLDKQVLKQVCAALLKWVAAEDPAGKKRKMDGAPQQLAIPTTATMIVS